MAIQIYRRQQAPGQSISDAITGATNGFVQGRKLRQDQEDNKIANAYKQAQIAELSRKSDAYNQPVQPGYFRDPVSGRLLPELPNPQNLQPGFTQVGGKVVQDPAFVKPLNDLQQAQLDEKNRKREAELQLQKDQEEALKNSAQESIDTIEKVKEGAKYFGPAGDLPSILAPSTLQGEYGKRSEWEANVNNLLSKKVIEVMNNMKKQSKTGATGFGALNKSELDILKNSSTVINRKLTPDVALKYLDDLENINKKIASGGKSNQSGLPMKKKYEVVAVD